MAVPPTTSEAEHRRPSLEASALLARLDTLLGRYLVILDEYEKSREQGQNNFKHGLFSLAEANFRSPNRTRYGQDLYDEKMQAIIVVEHVLPETNDATRDPMLRLGGVPRVLDKPSTDSPIEGQNSKIGALKEASPMASDGSSREEASTQTARKVQDPIRQFGVLVPPALRSAQGSFKEALNDWFDTINLSRQLSELEIEVRRVRKQLKRLDN